MSAIACQSNSVRLYSGRYLDLLDPQPDQFTLNDIATGLSRICRFGGQCSTWYSVAEHSILCAEAGRREDVSLGAQRALLFHDAAEAFIGDMVRPLKSMLSEYREIEQRIQSAIAARFNIDFEKHADLVDEIDLGILITERNSLFRADGVLWTGEDKARKVHAQLMNMSAGMAAQAFFDRAIELGIEA